MAAGDVIAVPLQVSDAFGVTVRDWRGTPESTHVIR